MLRNGLGNLRYAAMVLISILSAAPMAGAQAKPPARLPDVSQTMPVWQVQSAAHKLQHMIDSRHRNKDRDTGKDERVEAYFKQFAMYLARSYEINEADQFMEEGRRLIEDGCVDPLVYFGYAYACDEERQWKEAVKYYPKATIDMLQKRCSFNLVSLCALKFATLLDKIKQPDAARGQVQLAASMLNNALFDDEFESGFPRRLLIAYANNILEHDRCDQKIVDMFFLQLAHARDLDEATIKTIKGKHEIKVAWDYRGSDWAKNVTRLGWLGFKKHLTNARILLTEAYQLDTSRPEAATYMITVAMGGNAGPGVPGELERLWFERAIAADPVYVNPYTTYQQTLMPRWGGSIRALLDFGIECKDTEYYHTEIPTVLFFSVWDCMKEMKMSGEIWRIPGVYEEVADMFMKSCASPGLKGRHDYYRSLLACAALYAGRPGDVAELFNTLDGKLDPQALKIMKISKDQIQRQIDLHMLASVSYGDDA